MASELVSVISLLRLIAWFPCEYVSAEPEAIEFRRHRGVRPPVCHTGTRDRLISDGSDERTDGSEHTFLTTGNTHGFALSSRYAPMPWKPRLLASRRRTRNRGDAQRVGVAPPSRLCPCSGPRDTPSSSRRAHLRAPGAPPPRGSSLLLLRKTCGLRCSAVCGRERRKRKMWRGRLRRPMQWIWWCDCWSATTCFCRKRSVRP